MLVPFHFCNLSSVLRTLRVLPVAHLSPLLSKTRNPHPATHAQRPYLVTGGRVQGMGLRGEGLRAAQ